MISIFLNKTFKPHHHLTLWVVINKWCTYIILTGQKMSIEFRSSRSGVVVVCTMYLSWFIAQLACWGPQEIFSKNTWQHQIIFSWVYILNLQPELNNNPPWALYCCLYLVLPYGHTKNADVIIWQPFNDSLTPPPLSFNGDFTKIIL